MIWEVFYTPHTDDETLGMAGSILRARSAGHAVLVVLVTDNVPSTRGQRIFPDHDTALERRKEWTRAMGTLDVSHLAYWELSEEEMIAEPRRMQDRIQRKMWEIDQQYLVARHHTVWGKDDIHVEVADPTPSHVLCADALTEMQRSAPRIHASLHGVYLYSARYARRRAPIIQHLSSQHMAMKMLALNCFKPSETSIGYGYASVPELFDAASTDLREFIQEIPHDASGCLD